MTIYRFKDAAFGLAGLDAQKVGESLTQIKETRGLTGKTVVEEAKADGHPLHDYFLWDDAEAGERYREQQAGYLFRHIEAQETPESEPVRAFIHIEEVKDGEEMPRFIGPGAYQSSADVLNDPEKRAQVLLRALQELEALQRKYRQYKEFGVVDKAIEKFKKPLVSKKKAAA